MYSVAFIIIVLVP